MGQQQVRSKKSKIERKKFLKHLLLDVEALDEMLRRNLIEKNIQRIGAEQELSLVDAYYKPSRKGPAVLNRVNDPHLTTELALYNLEINLDPQVLKKQCFSKMEKQLQALLAKTDQAAKAVGDKVVLSGILPSIDIRSGELDFMTPNPRFYALDEVIRQLRGEDFELNILGVDELILAHTNILFEACNTSFQCHLQVDPDEFVDQYNWAQMISGPVLSACTNSPLLFGRELWSETRISLFQQSIDIRSKGYHLREKEQRVSFGKGWVSEITEIYKEAIARFTLILTDTVEEDSMSVLKKGGIPKLAALNLHNGTIWRWNRPCYGVGSGIPHLRIENRYLPSGPSVIDEMANFAFWVGLMKAMPEHYKGAWQHKSFEDAKGNFYRAATSGLHSSMVWEGKAIPSRNLLLDHLLPSARKGLLDCGIELEEADRYLNVLEGRVKKGLNGSVWTVKSFRNLKKTLSREEAMVGVTAAMHTRRMSGLPVHSWRLPTKLEIEDCRMPYDWIGNFMTTDLITVQEEDLLDLVEKIMDWKRIRHVPVEDRKGNLKGLITHKMIGQAKDTNQPDRLLSAADVMRTDLVTVGKDADIRFAILLMVDKQISCLPVVEGNRLIGLITDRDTQQLWEKMKDHEA
ncbi:MAG: CBS domain-containing protein [Lunatimonas sp.]|uniref:CBS domain-containing protein n=1 Tax=Lunatimonas sp. TaxID=2060141 RepID=UPI00263B433B|nr:CBS domain-containing protein [Lunatimonas sp.]MCC5938473.1 CBS domain-containing protein [Lunatimonas sp.]